MFSVGIIGLPNVGKSTLFKALTKIAVPIANYPFTTIDPHHGIVEIKDEKLEKIKELVNPQKTTYPLIEFIDIAGLVKNAHLGEGLGNQFLSNIGEADILLEVIRDFSISPNKSLEEKQSEQGGQTEYQLWEKPNPKRDIETLKNEILKRDQKILSNFLLEEEKKIGKKDNEKIELINKIIDFTKKEEWIFDKIKNESKEEKNNIENFSKKMGIISIKPIIYLFNTIEEKKSFDFQPSLCLNLKSEEGVSDLKDEEKEEIGIKSHLDDIVSTCYNELDLITFYTIKGAKEAKATELKKEQTIIEAAEKIHSDFKEKFISADILKFEDLLNSGSWQKAKEKGLLRTRGKDYIVQKGDIIEFKI